MRKFVLSAMFFLVCLSVFGQPSDRELKLFVLPIAGYGKEKDNDYFFKQLAYEVFFQHHTAVESKDQSNYIFKGTIEPVSGVPVKEIPPDPSAEKDKYGALLERAQPPVNNSSGRREFFSIEKDEEIYFLDQAGDVNSSLEIKAQAQEEGYFFILEMLDSGTGELLGRKKLLFYVTDASVGKLVSVIVYDLLSNIPQLPPKRGDSRDRWLYFEISALWMPRIYYNGYDKINLLGFGMKFGMELHFISFMSLGAGAQVTQDIISSGGADYQELTMEIPASIKFTLKIEDKYALEPYGGAALNYSLGNKIEHSKYSWFAGVQLGIKDISETGMFVIDPRFSMDFYDSAVPSANIEYRRYCVQLGFGYKFGAIQKKK
jgi:hypothetical protein